MKSIRPGIMLVAVILLMMSTYSCGIKYNIKGRVVDSETGKPIEGAAVSLHWFHYRLIPRLTGMTSGFESLAVYDVLTDADGYFETTKFLSGDHQLGVYKNGYVCWSSEYIFNPDPIGLKIKRTDHELKDGMVIKLDKFRIYYSKLAHAKFVIEDVDSTYNGKIFNDAIKNERLIYFSPK